MSQKAGEPYMQQIDLTTLSVPQLTQLKQQLDQVSSCTLIPNIYNLQITFFRN